MAHRTDLILGTLIFMAMMVVSTVAVAGENSSVHGTFWYDTEGDGDPVELTLVDGIAYPTELQGGERVKVILVPEPLDREKLIDVLSKGGMPLHAGLTTRVDFDVCRDEDGSNPQICGVHFYSPGISSSQSGFGVYGHFTKSIRFEDERVEASLSTTKPEEDFRDLFSIDLSFDLPITRFEKE